MICAFRFSLLISPSDKTPVPQPDCGTGVLNISTKNRVPAREKSGQHAVFRMIAEGRTDCTGVYWRPYFSLWDLE